MVMKRQLESVLLTNLILKPLDLITDKFDYFVAFDAENMVMMLIRLVLEKLAFSFAHRFLNDPAFQ